MCDNRRVIIVTNPVSCDMSKSDSGVVLLQNKKHVLPDQLSRPTHDMQAFRRIY